MTFNSFTNLRCILIINVMVPSIREAIKLIPQMSAIDILSLNVSRYKPVVYRPENNDVKNKMAVGIPIYV